MFGIMPVTSLPQNGTASATPPSSACSRGSSASELDTMTNTRPVIGVALTPSEKEMLNLSVPVGSAAADCVEWPSTTRPSTATTSTAAMSNAI